MLPVMAYNLLQSIELLSTTSTNFAIKCIDGIKANEERCRSLIEESLAMCTALAPEIGYEAAAKLAKDAYKSGKTVRQMAKEQQVLPEKRLTELLESSAHDRTGRAGGERWGIEGNGLGVSGVFSRPCRVPFVALPLLVQWEPHPKSCRQARLSTPAAN